MMPIACCVKNCRSTWEKNSKINFHRFPFQNSTSMKYWITATGRSNWIPYTGARICSLHFKNTDYDIYKEDQIERRYLKPGIIPTQNVHKNILEVFQQNTNYVLQHKIQEKGTVPIAKKYDQNNAISPNQQKLIIEINNSEKTVPTSSKCLKCLNYNEMLNENKKLKKKITEIKESQEKLLSQQAIMFNVLMTEKESVLQNKLKIAKDKNKTLNESIQEKEKEFINLKTLFKELQSRNCKDKSL